MHILVVDDFANAADSLSEWLTELGHSVSVAYSGVHALQAMRDLPPDLVLLDLNLPDLDGWHVAQALRDDGSECYIVAMTAANIPTYVARSARAGCDRHLLKPVAPADLEGVLASAEARRTGHCPRRKHPPSTPAPAR